MWDFLCWLRGCDLCVNPEGFSIGAHPVAGIKKGLQDRFETTYRKETSMQLFGLHKNIYKLARYGRTQELLESSAREREKILGDWEKLKKRQIPEKEIVAITGISRSVYYRRRKALARYGFKGLEDRSKRPQKVRTSQIPESVKQLILKLRQDNPTYGKAKLTVILKRDHGVTISESSVGRILQTIHGSGNHPTTPSFRLCKGPEKTTVSRQTSQIRHKSSTNGRAYPN